MFYNVAVYITPAVSVENEIIVICSAYLYTSDLNGVILWMLAGTNIWIIIIIIIIIVMAWLKSDMCAAAT